MLPTAVPSIHRISSPNKLMRAPFSGLASFLASAQGMVSASARGASASANASGLGQADPPPRGLFKLQGSTILAISAGDLTKWKGDAIVNAANEGMLGGGGVDGAIHRAAGGQLAEACYNVQPVPNSGGVRCPTGEARITPGFRLDAKFVIHTVGPVYKKKSVSAPLLRSSIKNSLLLCKEHGLKSVAFPAISCGVYGYPAEQAAEVAIETMVEFSEGIDLIEFVLFGKDTYIPFMAKATKILEAVKEAVDDEKDKLASKTEDQRVKDGGAEDETAKDDDALNDTDESSPPATCAASANPEEGGKPDIPEDSSPTATSTEEGHTAEATVDPMSQEETFNALDEPNQGGMQDPMSQETVSGELDEGLDATQRGEPMPQSDPEPQGVVGGNSGEVTPSRKRPAVGLNEAQVEVDAHAKGEGIAMETEEDPHEEKQAVEEKEEKTGGAVSETCDSAEPNAGT